VVASSSALVSLPPSPVAPVEVQQLVRSTGMSPANIRKRLRELRAEGLVVQRGGRGRPTTYERGEP
jgi:predicted ArsR family transcriptional regulator